MLALPHTFELETKNYVAEKLLGQGAEGSVYRGYEEGDPTKLVAIKYCSNMRNDELQFLKRYILNKDHPNIINYFDIHVANDERPYYIFVMELGETNLLDKVISRRHNLELNEILDIILQIATGIQTMHKIGYIHRDIKPENIILVNGKWKICDFGLTRNKLSTLTKKIGTAYYIAPEMIQTIEDSQSIESYDVKVDIWALGCLIYEIYTTKLFFNGSNFEEVIKGVQEFTYKYRSGIPDHPQFKNLPAPLENIVKRMLVVDKNTRLTIDEVIKEIQDLIKAAQNPFKTLRPGTKSNDPQQQQIPGNPQPVNQFPQSLQNNIPRKQFPVFSGQKPVFQQQFPQNPPPNFQSPPGINTNQTFTQNPPPQIFQQSNISIQPSINSQPPLPFVQQKMQEHQSQQPQNQQIPSFPKSNHLNQNIQNASFPNQTKVSQQSIQPQPLPTPQNVFQQPPGQNFQAQMVPQVAQNLQSQQQQNQIGVLKPQTNFQPQDYMAKQPSTSFQNNLFQQQQQNNLSNTQKLSENTQNQIKFSPAQQQNYQNIDQKNDTLSNGNSAQSKSLQIQQILQTKYVKLNSASIQNKLKLSSANEDESQICSKLVLDIKEIVGNLFLENHRSPIQQGSS